MSAALISLAVFGIVDNKLAIYVGISVFTLGLWMIWHLLNRHKELANMEITALILTLCLGLIIRGSYPSPGIRTLGDYSDEQAVLFMMENLEEGSRVASYAPGHVLAARMTFVRLPPHLRELETSEELYEWMIDNDLKAIHSINLLRDREPQIWSLIEDQMGKGLELAFKKDPGDIQVVLVHPPLSGVQD